jgi:hypothetical protein
MPLASRVLEAPLAITRSLTACQKVWFEVRAVSAAASAPLLLLPERMVIFSERPVAKARCLCFWLATAAPSSEDPVRLIYAGLTPSCAASSSISEISTSAWSAPFWFGSSSCCSSVSAGSSETNRPSSTDSQNGCPASNWYLPTGQSTQAG